MNASDVCLPYNIWSPLNIRIEQQLRGNGLFCDTNEVATRTVPLQYKHTEGRSGFFYFLTFSSGFLKLDIMWDPFQGCQGILRLLEIIFSTLPLIIVIFRGRMVSPWGMWCEFVWVFSITVPVVMIVMEAKMWHILLAAFLPDWADLTCGLTIVCAVTISSATIIFADVFICLSCIVNMLCFFFSLVATVVFLFDAVKQKKTFPNGYLSSRRGIYRGFYSLYYSCIIIACIILTAATDHYVNSEWAFYPFGVICSILVFAVCLLVTVVIIVLNLLKLLQCLLSFGLSMMDHVFNIAAVLLYLLAVIFWPVFGYKLHKYNPYICEKCSYADLNTVTIGAIVNLVLYIVDLFLSFKSC